MFHLSHLGLVLFFGGGGDVVFIFSPVIILPPVTGSSVREYRLPILFAT